MKILKCCHCKQYLPEENFYRDKSKPSGKKPRCKECEKEYLDKENRRQYEVNYRKEKPDKRRKIMRNYYEKHKESHNETQNKYRATEQFKINHRQHSAIRRARMAQAFIEPVNYYLVYLEYDKKCFYCGKLLEFNESEFDHYIPLAKKGLHKKDNIRCSCAFCNRSKGAKMPGEVCY